MGGQLDVASLEKEGSTFWFTFTLPVVADAPAPPPPAMDLAGVRVLIVDHNEVSLRVLHEQITSWGMRNGGFASGEEALAALRAAHAAGDPYQIAILDYQMPVMHGEMLARAIKSDPVLRETILVTLSSCGCRGEGERISEAGFAAYLVKPVRQSQVMNTLASVWGRQGETGGNKDAESHAKAEQEAAVKSSAAAEVHPVRARVLLAEDNAVSQKIATLMLEKLGCRVDRAANGLEVLQMIDLLPYDVVFMDCELPELDGYRAAGAIREREGSGRHVPVIAMTAHAMAGDRARCLNAGMDDYISKPVRQGDLRNALNRWVPQKAGECASAADQRES